MRKFWCFGTVLVLIGSFFTQASWAQADGESDPDYFRKNLALTNFGRLGVDGQTYARCLTVTNYLDPAVTPKLVVIKEEEFRDDGSGFDQRANDGILTSVRSFLYERGETVIPPGQYQKSPTDYMMQDEIFQHEGTERIPFFGIRVRCRTRSFHCSDLPEPQSTICFNLGPPYFHFQILGCDLQISLW